MAIKEALNTLFYIPTSKDLVGNAVLSVCAVLLAVTFHYLPVEPSLTGLLQNSSGTFRSSLLVGMAFTVNYFIVLFAIDKYFLNSRQSSSASVGTTIVVCVAYALVWSLYRLHTDKWQLLDSLKAGSVLAFLSSIPLRALTYKGNQESFDFTILRKAAIEWKRLAQRIEKSNYLNKSDHEAMKNVTESMLQQLGHHEGFLQPIAARASEKLKEALDIFRRWYLHETRASHK